MVLVVRIRKCDFKILQLIPLRRNRNLYSITVPHNLSCKMPQRKTSHVSIKQKQDKIEVLFIVCTHTTRKHTVNNPTQEVVYIYIYYAQYTSRSYQYIIQVALNE